ncbi:MAG TPA: efflux RND transporter periplasmic adaptor subunit [Candidatus Paceibacterota bacterium]|jgi:HlyD family secretion protein|nr:efflux RND transporter periplasmic adaptor subunit [Candidatus Paceibacterota bacterium]
MNKIKSYFIAHKIISIVGLVLIILVGYFTYKKYTSTTGESRYITAKVERGTIVASVSGSGQVSSLDQIDVKPKISGNAIYVAVQNGQKIGTGGLIAELDNKDAQKTVRDGEISLESAQISLDKLKIQNSAENMNTSLAKSYDDGFNTVSNVFLDLPGIMTGLNDMFFKSSSGTQQQLNIDWYEAQVRGNDQDEALLLKQSFLDSYKKAQDSYSVNFNTYKTVSRSSDGATIEALITQTYNTAKLISDAIKNAGNYIDFVQSSIQKSNADVPVIIATHKAILNTDTGKTNTALSNLLSITTDIKTEKDAFPNSNLDIQSATLSVTQKQNALQDAKDKLADYFIRAPFDGTIASISIKKSDSVSAGTVVATLITKKQIAEISLNEVDVAKIKIGQKATLTFDAIPDLTISGMVGDIDTIGTVAQGVVTYIVKISFDTQDERVKPGMSVSASIITDIKQNVLIVPNSAVKSQSGQSYVENFNAPLLPPTDGLIGSISKITPNKIPVEVGLTNDSQSEIISGVIEGDEIITRTILPTTKTAAAAPSLFGNTGGNRGTGGGTRIPAR